MSVAVLSERPLALAPVLNWRRVRVTLGISILLGLLLGTFWQSGLLSVLERTVAIGLMAMIVFGLFESWPRRLPRPVARWVWQVLGVALSVPIVTFVIYVLTTEPGAPPFWQDPLRRGGFFILSVLGVLIGPWVALAALVRQKDALARHQRLAFDLQRSELERQALDARLRLLQGQVAPHFLFNTLANVQELVETRSPQAPVVLDHLITYLRAAVPRLQETATTLDGELHLVRSYLELMRMRMPDRLEYSVHIDDEAVAVSCPPTTLLTLVENAVRHGIDPSEEGGRIDIEVRCCDGRCLVRVSDTGVGFERSGGGLGTGLSTLRERLRLVYGDEARLSLKAGSESGVVAEVEIPIRRGITG